jgi:mono/diheme cytochrome c family protein
MILRKAALIALSLTAISAAIFATRADTAAQDVKEKLTREEARLLKSPVPYTKDSINKGRTLFTRDCAACHGPDGKSEMDVVANATNLTEPKLWRSGTSEGEIFRSVRDGAGEVMPPFKAQYQKDEEIWTLVNFIRSLWPEPERPKLQESRTNK